MSLKVYINGTLYAKEDAKISVYDHGLLYGDGVFEGMRSYHGTVFRLDKHIDRLWRSAEAIFLTIPMTKQKLCDAVVETLEANNFKDAYVRLVVTRGAGSLGLGPDKTRDPQVIIITDYIELYPDEFYEKGLEIITSTIIRNHPRALSASIKSLNYLNNILAKIEGLKSGCHETLMLNYQNEVAECTGDNIFLVAKGAVYTPPVDACILEGITREAVMELARQGGLQVHETPLTTQDVYQADECFLTGSAAEVVPVIRVDGHTIGSGYPGPITLDLKDRFHALARA